MARPAGLEPATSGLEIHCSIQLSYGRNRYNGAKLTWKFQLGKLGRGRRVRTELDHAAHCAYARGMFWGARAGLVLVGCGAVMFAACGGGTPSTPEVPEEPMAEETPPPAPEPATDAPAGDADSSPEAGEGENKPTAASGTEPEFKEGMSVDEAIAAVPRDAQRMNLDGDTLGKPLMNQTLYEPCKLGQNQKFKVRVAIWNGKAVGLDVTTQPNNPKAAQCIATQIRSVTWRDKVPSLNTVEFSM